MLTTHIVLFPPSLFPLSFFSLPSGYREVVFACETIRGIARTGEHDLIVSGWSLPLRYLPAERSAASTAYAGRFNQCLYECSILA